MSVCTTIHIICRILFTRNILVIFVVSTAIDYRSDKVKPQHTTGKVCVLLAASTAAVSTTGLLTKTVSH